MRINWISQCIGRETANNNNNKKSNRKKNKYKLNDKDY